MNDKKPIGVGVIGLGFMGATHVRAYEQANRNGVPNKLVAICDSSPSRRSGSNAGSGNMGASSRCEPLFDPRELTAYECAAPLLADPQVDLVSICTPTDSHVDLAIEALAMGKHVLVEKPVALRSKDVARLARAAAASRRLCMPAHCMRFWPGWEWLHGAIRSRELGAVRSAKFSRTSPVPDWSPEFYGDPLRCGGPLADLHVHDADFVLWCFGTPIDVVSRGSAERFVSHYDYGVADLQVSAEVAWELSAQGKFRMTYEVQFERARASFDSGKERPFVLEQAGAPRNIDLPAGDGYLAEVQHILRLIQGAPGELRVGMPDALAVAQLLEREAKSLGLP